jgi:hypothetical protein
VSRKFDGTPRHGSSRSAPERELFFWTANRALWLVLCIALTIYVIVMLCEGRISFSLSTSLKSLLSSA